MLERQSLLAKNIAKAAKYTGATFLSMTLTMGAIDISNSQDSSKCTGPTIWLTPLDTPKATTNLLWPRRVEVDRRDNGQILVSFEPGPQHDQNVWNDQDFVVLIPHCDQNNEPMGQELITYDGQSIILENLDHPGDFRVLNEDIGIYWYYEYLGPNQSEYVIDVVHFKSEEIEEVFRGVMCGNSSRVC